MARTFLRITTNCESLPDGIDDEMRSHIEMRAQKYIEAGMNPNEARLAALEQFGWTESIKETCREQSGLPWLENLVQDIRYGARQLRKNPGFTVVAVLTLGLGIGACTAMFSLINAVLLRPLPFHDSDHLVWLENIDSSGLSGRTIRMDTFMEWRAERSSIEELAAYYAFFDEDRYTLIGNGDPQRLRGVPVSQNFLEVLGVKPALGRSFTDQECVLNGRKAAILSHAFWQQQFGGDPSVVGRSINLKGQPTEIVGVLPPAFDFASIFAPGSKVEVLVPLPVAKELAGMGNILFAIGRLKPDASVGQVQEEFNVINQRLVQAHPERTTFGARISSVATSIRGTFRQPLLLLFAAVGCVLLIACANISNLLLARANARRKEFAVRTALGATRWRLIRQTLTESLLLSIGGCALGVPLAFMATSGLAPVLPLEIPLLRSVTVDATALGFTTVMAVLAGIITGMLPALQLMRGNTQERLNATNSRSSGGTAGARVRKALVIAEIATACVLLVGAGLLIQSFAKLLEVNLGFQPKHAVAWRVDPPRSFRSLAERTQYYDQLVSQVLAIPSVESVGLSDSLPLGRNRSWGVGAKGISYPKDQMPTVFPRLVDHRYLPTMKIPLRSGRLFDLADTTNSTRVAVINETMARRLWPGQEAVGQVITGINPGDYTVVGVVGDVRHGKLEEAASSEVYLNFRQNDDWAGLDLVVRTTRPASSLAPDVRTVMKAFDPTLPGTEFIALEQMVDHAVAPRRLITILLGAFSSLALMLSAIGLYGVIAYSVAQRTREIGIRLAIGAQRGDVVNMVVAEGFKMAAIGVFIGLLAALLLTRVLNSLLFGVTATDPFIFIANATILVAVALLACAIPARRAAKVDPMVALRQE